LRQYTIKEGAIMKKFVLTLVVMVLAASAALASQEPATAPAPATSEEISSLRAEIAELKTAIAGLRAAQPQKTVSIGVLPIDRANRIPEVGESFREVLISALREAGIFAVESLDDETLRWVQRQDQLVRERWIDPVSAPPRGELKGVSHYLLATVTRYEEQDVEDVKVLAGILVVRFGGGARIKTGSLVVDFRLVDARSGDVIDALRAEASVKCREYAGGVIPIGGGYRHKRPLPEQAARAVAEQAAERIAILVHSVAVPTATAKQ
jgi:curli biogenesis system outer membrane secretion channel CsgG